MNSSLPKGYYWDARQLDACNIEMLGVGMSFYDICRDTFKRYGNFWPA